MSLCIQNGNLVLPDRVIEGGTLIAEKGRIAYAGEARPTPPGAEACDARGRFVTPGLIDLHIHGAGAHSLDPPNPASFRAIAEFLLSRGVTHFMPTMMACRPYVRQLADMLGETGNGARALGLYPEGPFISTEKKGGVLPEYIESVDLDLLATMQEECQGKIRFMTFAPELPGAERLIAAMDDLGILPCMGHSATGAARARFVAGRARVNCTHLFNAMSGLDHHRPGLAAMAMNVDSVWVELNPDGTHVAPELLRLVWRAKRRDRICLISDAVISAGAPEGDYEYMGAAVRAGRMGVFRRADDTLVGSRCLLNEGLMRFRRWTKASLPEAVALATRNPAALLGRRGRSLGTLEVGKEANVVVFPRTFSRAYAVFLAGRRVL